MSRPLYRLSSTVKMKRMVMVCLSLSLVLLVALGGLAYYTFQTRSELAETKQNLIIAEELNVKQQGELDSATSENAEKDQALSQKDEQLSEKEKELKKKEKELKEKDETIRSLKTRISLKAAGKPTYTTTTLDQDLPEREYANMKGKKLVALTFDDGPGPYTERLLDAMKARGVKATFFVLGERVNRYGDLIKRMAKEGHVIGNHSYDHPNLTRLSYDKVRVNMEKTAKAVQKLIGYKPELMRSPGGSSNNTVKKYAKAAGIPILHWDVDTRDWESRNVEKILKVSFGKDGIENGSIVLMHDIYETTVDAAIQMMDRLINEGYTLVTVPELLMARYGSIVPGKIYG